MCVSSSNLRKIHANKMWICSTLLTTTGLSSYGLKTPQPHFLAFFLEPHEHGSLGFSLGADFCVCPLAAPPAMLLKPFSLCNLKS